MKSVRCSYKSIPNFWFKMAPGGHAHNISFKDPWRQTEKNRTSTTTKSPRPRDKWISIRGWGKRAGGLGVFIFHLLNFHFVASPRTLLERKAVCVFSSAGHFDSGLYYPGTGGLGGPSSLSLLCYVMKKAGYCFFISASHGHLSTSTDSNPRRQLDPQLPPVHSGTCSWMGCAQNTAH